MVVIVEACLGQAPGGTGLLEDRVTTLSGYHGPHGLHGFFRL
jgi:hypothetical protein